MTSHVLRSGERNLIYQEKCLAVKLSIKICVLSFAGLITSWTANEFDSPGTNGVTFERSRSKLGCMFQIQEKASEVFCRDPLGNQGILIEQY